MGYCSLFVAFSCVWKKFWIFFSWQWGTVIEQLWILTYFRFVIPVHRNSSNTGHLNFLSSWSQWQQIWTFFYQSRGCDTTCHKTKDIMHYILPWNSYNEKKVILHPSELSIKMISYPFCTLKFSLAQKSPNWFNPHKIAVM